MFPESFCADVPAIPKKAFFLRLPENSFVVEVYNMDRLVGLTVRNTVELAEILLTPPPGKVKVKVLSHDSARAE